MKLASPPTPKTPLRRLRRLLPYLGGLGLLLALIYGLQPRPALVETASPVRGDLFGTVSDEGKTRIRQRYIIYAPADARLQRITLKPGAPVLGGETLLAKLDPVPSSPLDPRNRALYETRRRSAKLQLEKAAEALALAQKDRQRLQRLVLEGSFTQRDLEGAQLRETLAAGDCVAAEAARAEADAVLASFGEQEGGAGSPLALRAPVSGLVLQVFQESERVVPMGTPLLEIGDPAQLEITLEMLSRDGAALRPGARVLVEQWGGPQPLQARVRLVEPSAFTKISALGVEEQRVHVVADLLSPLEERASLGDHFRVEGKVLVWEAKGVLKVPTAGLFRDGANWASYVLRQGRAVLTPVEVGRNNGLEAEVLRGLEPGDEVLLYPGDRIRPGQRVKAIQVRHN